LTDKLSRGRSSSIRTNDIISSYFKRGTAGLGNGKHNLVCILLQTNEGVVEMNCRRIEGATIVNQDLGQQMLSALERIWFVQVRSLHVIE